MFAAVEESQKPSPSSNMEREMGTNSPGEQHGALLLRFITLVSVMLIQERWQLLGCFGSCNFPLT